MLKDVTSYDAPPTHNASHEPIHNVNYLQHAARRDPRRVEDRPKIPQELWDQLDLAAKLWYCGRDKDEIDKIVANQSRKQSVQNTMLHHGPGEVMHQSPFFPAPDVSGQSLRPSVTPSEHAGD